MKVIKTNVYRLEIERECGCKASGEYEDPRYLKIRGATATSLCTKHQAKSADAQEILEEMLLDALTMQAELASKQYAPMRREVDEGDSGGVVAVGESVQAMGATNLPKRSADGSPRTRPKKDPMTITQVSVDRSDQRPLTRTAATAVSATEMGDGITITGDIIDPVAEDPALSGLVVSEIEGAIEEEMDAEDMKLGGVPRSALNQARD